MADLKSLLGDKYTEGMTIEDVLSLEVEEPKADTSAYDNLKKRFDEVASEAAGYKKQLRANMTEAEQKAAADAEKLAEIVAERDKLKAEKAIAENAKGLVAIGYDEALATEVATALHNGDAATVIKAQAKFVDAQKKAVLADAVKEVYPESFYVYGREGIVGKRDEKEIGIHAVRGGSIVGEHDVIFAGESETVTISHQATDRAVFGELLKLDRYVDCIIPRGGENITGITILEEHLKHMMD